MAEEVHLGVVVTEDFKGTLAIVFVVEELAELINGEGDVAGLGGGSNLGRSRCGHFSSSGVRLENFGRGVGRLVWIKIANSRGIL